MAVITTIGILYPGYSAEDDYPIFERLLGNDVRLPLVHTQMEADDPTPAMMRASGNPGILAEGAHKLAPERLDALIWACNSGSFTWGWEGAREQARQLQQVAGVPTSSTSLAFVAAARHLKVRRVAVVATYPDELSRLFVGFLAAAGIEVVRLASRGVSTAAEVSVTMGRRQVIDFAVRNDDPAAEAIILCDTALHTAAHLEELERRTGKIVLTANQVSVWRGLRLAGQTKPRPGLGRLLRA